MSFLAPLYLLLGLAAGIPLLLHLMRRKISTRVDFPAARYLARAERENSRRLRMRNLLLMLLRVVAIILLAAAAARPVGRIGAGSGHAPSAVVLVIDNTLSSSVIIDGRPLLEQLKDAARRALAVSTPADRFWLVTADARVSGGTQGAVFDAIDRVQPLAGGGSMADAVLQGAALVRGAQQPGRALAILTDGQPSSWPEVVETGDREVVVAVLSPRVALPANRAVVHTEARPLRWTPRGEVHARVRTNDSATYRIGLGDRTLARGAIAPGEEILVRASPPERGWLAGLVEIQPDELRGDDIRHFAVWIGSAPGVRVSDGAGPFARSAIDALVEGGRMARGADATVVAADELQSLPALIVAPSDPVRLGAANRALERAGVPWRFGALRTPVGQQVRPLADEEAHLWEGVTVSRRYLLQLEGAAAADTIATVAGEPWIVAGTGYLIVGSPLHPDATSLPVRASFVPWLAEALTQRVAGGTAASVLEASPGQLAPRPPHTDELEAEDGHRIALEGGSFRAPSRPGVYFLLRGGERAGALVVNGDPDESVLGRMDDADLAARFGGDAVRVIADTDEWVAAIFGESSRRSLLFPLLLVGLLALIGESALAGGGRRARP